MPQNPILDSLAPLQGIAQTAAQPERTEPGPGDVGPTTVDKDGLGLVTLSITEEEVTAWFERVNRARARVKAREGVWDILLNEYLPTVSKSGEAETVKVQGHFRNVHSKIGQLFYREPDLVLTPRDPGPATNMMPSPPKPDGQPGPPMTMEDIISVKQAMLSQKLGRGGVKINRLADECLFDVLAWSGVACSKLGYRCVQKPYQEPVMQPDPSFVPPPMQGILGLGPSQPPPQVPVMDPTTGQPMMREKTATIYEEWYWRRFSPKKWLCNDDLRSTRYDEDATWQGMEFFMSKKAAMSAFKLTEEEATKAAEDDRIHPYREDQEGGKAKAELVHGVEIWCKASIFTDELHPQAINQLVLIEGIPTKAFVWRPSPDQTFDELGKLTVDSLVGFPIRILTIRDLPDSPFPMSDSAFTNSEIKQLSTWRRQSIKIRDAAIGKYFYDMDVFDEKEVEILQNGEIGAFIGVMGGKLAQGADKVFTTTAQIHATQDDYRGAEIIQRDIQETLGIPTSMAGMETQTIRSATETAAVTSGAQARSEKELGRVVDWYLDGARMLDQLIMRYATEEEYVQVTGQNGAQRMMVWDRQRAMGKYLYDIAPDSQMRVDSAQDFKMLHDYYNITAKDPFSNRLYVLKRMARMRGMDPSKATLDQSQIPKPEPEKPKISFAFNGEDLANPLVVALLVANEIIPAQAAAMNRPVMQPEHGGANPTAPTVNQHAQSNSGKRPNEPGAENRRESQP